MPVLSLSIEIQLRFEANYQISIEEVFELLAIKPELLPLADQSGRQLSICISKALSSDGVSDLEFDTWAAGAFNIALSFLNRLCRQHITELKAKGAAMQVCVDIIQSGDYSIIEWPLELYNVVERLDIGLVSTWN